MAIENVRFDNKNGPTDLRNAIRPIALAAFADAGAAGIAIFNAPEIMTGILAAGIVVAILMAVDLAFGKARDFLGVIPLIGHPLIGALNRINNWVHGLFHWIDSEVHNGLHDIAHGVYDTFNRLYNDFARPDRARIAALENSVHSLTSQLAKEVSRASTAESTLHALVLANVSAIILRIDTLVKNYDSEFKALASSITSESLTRISAIAAVRKLIADEATARQKEAVGLQNEITTLTDSIANQIKGIRNTILGDETTIAANESKTALAIAAATGEISTTQQEITQANKTIAGVETQIEGITQEVQSIPRVVASPLEWTAAEIATLTELANDPCMCFDAIGGVDVLLTLIAGLEVGIL